MYECTYICMYVRMYYRATWLFNNIYLAIKLKSSDAVMIINQLSIS